MNKQSVIVLFILFFVVAAAGYLTYKISQNDDGEISEETRKIFTGSSDSSTYIDIDGNPVSLNDFLGRILVVSTWASWSPFSQADLTTLAFLSTRYKAEDVVFLAINRKEPKEIAQRYLSSIPIVSGVTIVIDQEDLFYSSVGGYAMPETVVFDKKGEILLHLRGLANETELIRVIDESLVVKE